MFMCCFVTFFFKLIIFTFRVLSFHIIIRYILRNIFYTIVK